MAPRLRLRRAGHRARWWPRCRPTMARLWLRMQAMRDIRKARLAGALDSLRASGAARSLAAGGAGAAAGASSARAALVLRDNLRNRAAHRAGLPPRDRPRARGDHHRQRLLRAGPQDAPGAGVGGAARRARCGCCCRAATNTSCSTTRRGRSTARCCAPASQIHEYSPSFLHAKVAVIDGHWATVGSSNLDPLSLLLAREANVVVDDARFAGAAARAAAAGDEAGGPRDERGRVQQPAAAPACDGVRGAGADAAGPG